MDTLKYERLKQVIKHNIRDGIWKSGDKLPAERLLCEHFGVSKITVKKAKDDLIAEGVLENLSGRKGTFVRRNTRKPSTDFIGVAIDNIKEAPFVDMLKGIEDKLWEHRLHPTLCTAYPDIERIEAYFQSLLQREVAGIIFTPVRGREHLENNKRIIEMFAEKSVPHVLLDRYIPDRLVNSVVSNNRQASKQLTKVLIERGHTRILVLAGVECSSIDERLQGHLEALKEAGLKHHPNLIIRIDEDVLLLRDQQPQRDELERVRDLITQAGDFTACYPLNTTLQIAVRVAGRDVRKDIEIATYDDIINDLRGLTNRVIVVKQHAYRMGWEAARLLIDTIDNPDQPIIQMTLQAEIIEEIVQ